jgi:hypothetical protein
MTKPYLKKLSALLAALTLLLALAGCGGTESGDAPDDPVQAEQPIAEENDQQPETPPQEPEEAGEDPADGEEAAAEEAPPSAPEESGMTLSRTDFTLFQAGSSYRLTAAGADGACTYTSSDPKVAAVGGDGTVTAVSPGKAVITVTSGSESRTCVVWCRWTAEEQPADEPAEAADDPAEKPAEKPADESVDLSAFYQDTTAKHTFQTLEEFTGEILDAYYPGMSGVAAKQCLIMGTMLSMNNGEFCLVEVTDAADVDTVKGILQGRIDYMAETGAWYPGPTELWTNSSRVVSNGNYVMMVVHEDCDQIVEEFNALFQ